MNKNRHTTYACFFVMMFGFGLFFTGTEGFSSFTAETARVNQLMKENPQFPDIKIEDSKGRNYTISEFEGKHVLITFFYTSCMTVCIELELNMGKVYELIPKEYIGDGLIFLSLSFDPTRDDPEKLDQYKDHFNSDGETWRMARIPNQQELDLLLKNFGVIVIPDNDGNFAHNSAFYLLDKEGKLIEVMDYTQVEEAAIKIERILDKEAGE